MRTEQKNYKKVYILYKLWNEMLLCMTYLSTFIYFLNLDLNHRQWLLVVGSDEKKSKVFISG